MAWADGKTKLKLESMWGLTYPAMAKAAESNAQIAQRVDQYIHGRLLALYDLQADPGQRVNLIDAPSHREIAARMKQHMLEEMQRTRDPQLENYRTVLNGKTPVLEQNPQRYRIAGD